MKANTPIENNRPKPVELTSPSKIMPSDSGSIS